MRVGHGWDLHKLAKGRTLVVGGVEIAHHKGPVGHSDGDVVLHALMDALLGAAGLGDIGGLFPDTDPEWKDARSSELFERVMDRVAGAGYRVINADVTLVAQAPKIQPHREAIRERLAALLGVESKRVNVKAKTAEGIGEIGREEAMASHAVVLLEEV